MQGVLFHTPADRVLDYLRIKLVQIVSHLNSALVQIVRKFPLLITISYWTLVILTMINVSYVNEIGNTIIPKTFF